MNDKLWNTLVGAIRSVRERYEVADSWQTWADEVLAGVVTTSGKVIEAAAAAGALEKKGTEPQQRIARAANAIAHAATMAAIHGDGAAPEVKRAVEIVEREIQSE